MKLKLKEPQAPRYLYINPETNTVHLLMPIMSGKDIGLDNTCKSVYSLTEFFGLMGANKQADALGELQRYKEALEFDLNHLRAGDERTRKEERLRQIKAYLTALAQIQNEARITTPLKQAFPVYPEALESLMQTPEANLYSIILRPREQDVQLRTTALVPVFSANHGTIKQGRVINKESLLYDTLASSYQGIRLQPKSKEGLIKRVAEALKDTPVDFAQVQRVLSEEVQAYLGVAARFDEAQANDGVPKALTKAYVDAQMGFNEANPATHEDYAQALLGYCAPHLFDALEGSPFATVDNQERLSILTQFFLAELNLAYYAQELTRADFGQILERNFELSHHLAETVKNALVRSASVEEALIEFVAHHQEAFGCSALLTQEQRDILKQRFKAQYELIKDSPHFDEFMLLSDKPGLFVTHQGCITTHFADFTQTGFFDDVLDESTQHFLQQAQQDFDALHKPQNTIPHKNELELTEVEIDLASMDHDALQALYEDINRYQDPKTKEACLAQFKHERPDFKPKIDAKAFLQQVAYGQQEEAEALLKQDPQRAQELLRAHNIAFIDYSGRTFKCTAYEYAYWAKDTHMQRMLEKYICKDEETRQLTLHRVLDIEKPENPNASADFFANPNAPLKKNKGLDYTTTNEQGEIIPHNDTHFSLQPLIESLTHYIDAYNQSPRATNADWMALDAIWIKEVGGAQRHVPAHIAQEYCHPDRSFEEVTNNKTLLDADNPINLKRQLTFYNWDTGNNDLWFTPNSYASNAGLGFSIGILRLGGMRRGPWCLRGQGLADLSALKAIDEVRTSDLQQSLDHLRSPLIVQASPSHGF
jgi:hypothetical protein